MKITFKIWILIICVVAAIFAINPFNYMEDGVVIKSIGVDSPESFEGFAKGEVIKTINGKEITSPQDYNDYVDEIFGGISQVNWSILTENGTFTYESFALGFDLDENLTITSLSQEAAQSGLEEQLHVFEVNEQELMDQTSFYALKNEEEPKVRVDIKTNKDSYVFLTPSLSFSVAKIPKTNLRAGLDIAGGSKALVKPEEKLTDKELNDLITITKERLNVFGLSDVVVRSAKDSPFPGANTFMLIEVAGASPAELEELIGRQGKFEAKIGNDTVFIGGKKDITHVCRNDPKCSGVKPVCPESSDGYACTFEFGIYLSQEAAETQAELTKNLAENVSVSGQKYLSKTLDLYLDDQLVDSLQISVNLKGQATTNIAISGPGFGATEQAAFENALAGMAQLQTVLITGSLPVKLTIEKLDSISSILGTDFIKNIFLAGLAAALAVVVIVFIRYRDIKLTIPVLLTLACEIILILGFAAAIKWNLDLASIAGIIAAIGTGVDHLIIIIDESKDKKASHSLKERIKRAFFIIFGAFATTFFAMIPLWWAGAGIIRGFAVTTIIGIMIGVFITRPAFASIVEQISKE